MTHEHGAGGGTFEYVCRCGWEGTAPVFDAHTHAWCPRCGKPADFKLPDR